MQQVCSNCRYPLQPGNAVCTNCGTPVNAMGGGSYDPTINPGSAPSPGYGQSPYGAPTSADSYSGQYSAPQGTLYGAQPGAPYGVPQPNQYGMPQGAPVFTPVPPKPRSRRGILFGAIALI